MVSNPCFFEKVATNPCFFEFFGKKLKKSAFFWQKKDIKPKKNGTKSLKSFFLQRFFKEKHEKFGKKWDFLTKIIFIGRRKETAMRNQRDSLKKTTELKNDY